jgi:hypothetical protein
MERLDPVPARSPWQANQLPAHRHLLAAAQLEARGTEVFAPAGATFEPFLSLDRLQELYSHHYIIPPMPPWLWSG